MFQMPKMDQGGNRIPASVANVIELYLPNRLIDQFVYSTNAYAKRNMAPAKVSEVDRADILRFLAIYYYMGVVKLPCKRDYWKTDHSFWPFLHSVVVHMKRDRFEYLWKNIHMTEVEGPDLINELIDEDEESLDEVEEEEIDDDDDTVGNPEAVTWFSKAEPLMEQVRKVTKVLCKYPGFACSIDEMMKLFKGRSGQTWRMKHKPVKEGYKFFALCDVETGLVYSFFPDGRLNSNTIVETVGQLIRTLPDPDQRKYLIGLDNYFTTDKSMLDICSLGIGFVGTARGRRGWPPKELKEVEETRFNCTHLLPSTNGDYLMARWVDNNIVTMVTNVHRGNESVVKNRKKPRPNQVNKDNLDAVWGDDYCREIKIPCFIDDYNNMMLGVDKADQLIAYYRPKLRCRRVWMPIMFHALDILRINAYTVVKHCGDQRLEQKEFVEELIHVLLGRAASEEAAMTRNAVKKAGINTPSPTGKRPRTSTTNPTLPEERFLGIPSEHVQSITNKQGACRYCSYLNAMHKITAGATGDAPKVRNPSRVCVFCGVHLCLDHFAIYHQR